VTRKRYRNVRHTRLSLLESTARRRTRETREGKVPISRRVRRCDKSKLFPGNSKDSVWLPKQWRVRRWEEDPAAAETGGERRRKSCRGTSTRVESRSSDPDAGEHSTRDAELHPAGSKATAECHADRTKSQVTSPSSVPLSFCFPAAHGGAFKRVTSYSRKSAQVLGGTDEEKYSSRERGRHRAEGEQSSRAGILHVRVVLGAVLPPQHLLCRVSSMLRAGTRGGYVPLAGLRVLDD